MSSATTLKGGLSGSETPEPNLDQLMKKLMKLQEGKNSLEQEVKQLKSTSEILLKSFTALQTDAQQVEEIHKEKQELCRMLQFQCEESEQESSRQLNENKKMEEVLEQYRCETQEFKLKQRKQRMKFENQLLQLIEQHKNLYSVFSPDRLPEGLTNAENKNRQLLSAEQLKLAQLHKLSQEVEELKEEKMSGASDAQRKSESTAQASPNTSG